MKFQTDMLEKDVICINVIFLVLFFMCQTQLSLPSISLHLQSKVSDSLFFSSKCFYYLYHECYSFNHLVFEMCYFL